MMQIPSGLRGDPFAANRTLSCLPLPDGQKLSAAIEMVCHFHGITFLKIGFVRGIEWICRTKYFDMTLDLHVRCFLQAEMRLRSIALPQIATEHPVFVLPSRSLSAASLPRNSRLSSQ